MPITPYTTRSGVKIGLLYEQPLASTDGDMELLQRALLLKPKRPWRNRVKLALQYLVIITAVLTLSGLT